MVHGRFLCQKSILGLGWRAVLTTKLWMCARNGLVTQVMTWVGSNLMALPAQYNVLGLQPFFTRSSTSSFVLIKNMLWCCFTHI